MERIEELANSLSYDEIATRYATASELKSGAVAELSMLKEVIRFKLAHDNGVRTSTRQHEVSGQTLTTSELTIGDHRARIRQSIVANCDVNGFEERLQSLLAETIARGDTQVSRREMLREMLQMLQQVKSYSRRETVDII